MRERAVGRLVLDDVAQQRGHLLVIGGADRGEGREVVDELLRTMLKDEPGNGPFGDLVTRLIALAS